MSHNINRRHFMLAGAAAAGSIAFSATQKQQPTSIAASQPTLGTMPERILGKTGVSLPVFGLGTAYKPIKDPQQEAEAIELIEKAIALGIRYFDTAANSDYGSSEDHLGKVLPAYRDNIFLATKSDARDRDGAWRDLEKSLKRLNTDYLDLWQMHHVSFMKTLDEMFAANGAMTAIAEAKEQGIIRYTGITGHHEPDVIAEGLRRYPFDTTLISLNAAEVHHPRSFADIALPVAKQQNVGVIAMKVPAYGRLFKPGLLEGMEQAMGYALSLSGVHCCIISADSVAQLESNVRVAQNFQPLSAEQMAAIEQRTAGAWEDNTFFRAWT
ncbi:aldo/keto reductase [Roseofilum casamattae]|uniref:Aldo/keto reductase n=1 Tax=Roseofilum casamattae BLCC-M143 TaxID=3022442 RepID=A0ABT7C0H9_9CYAN|nr:aldo/keto reductase [Roseofilum casamattae]MDJ1184964.1 aldo/keto reductase [Roseofilum casamattae BLCC-M143]